jgi:hypothetical protein
MNSAEEDEPGRKRGNFTPPFSDQFDTALPKPLALFEDAKVLHLLIGWGGEASFVYPEN